MQSTYPPPRESASSPPPDKDAFQQTDLLLPLQPLTQETKSNIEYKTLLLTSYSALLTSALVFFVVSGLATLWTSTMFLGAVSSFASIPFCIVMLVLCGRRPHVRAVAYHTPSQLSLDKTQRGTIDPPPSSLGTVVFGGFLIASLWLGSLVALIPNIIQLKRGTARAVIRDNRGLVLVELGLAVVAFCSSAAVAGVQQLQRQYYGRLNAPEPSWR